MTVIEIRNRVFKAIAAGGENGTSLWQICQEVFESDSIADCINIEMDIVFKVIDELLESGTIDKVVTSSNKIDSIRIYRLVQQSKQGISHY